MNSSQEIANKIDREVEINGASLSDEQTKQSAGPQVMLGIAMLGFVGFMVNSWHRQLEAVQTAPETTAATASVVETKKTPEKLKTSSAAALLSAAPKVPVVAPAPAEEITEPEEITESAEITPEAIAELNGKLYNKIDRAWRIIPTFNQSLVYRIEVNQNGEMASYESLNQVASDYIAETGIDTLTKSESFIADAQTEPTVPFLAVLSAQGVLEVSPWVD
ncbi:MAG: hypothetical protein GDA48_27275 [Hormoscilla sp. GM102CHS1]|nr:hypothetical protein [Hormoscilla sp. GM102CHS1]